MQLRGFSVRTHRSYLYVVESLARYYHRSPDQLSVADVQAFLQHLAVERALAPATCRLHLNGIRFLFVKVLGREDFAGEYDVPKRQQRIPELLTHAEVRALLLALENHKQRILLTTCYGCGLRVSELVHIKVRHIDSERKLLHVDQGKGAKDRLVPISPSLLEQLRGYWREYRPKLWLFPGQNPKHYLSPSTAQKAYRLARSKAGISKVGGIHALRHAYATHQLEAGLPVHRLQRYLGHQDIKSTLRYLHWVPEQGERRGVVDLLAELEVDHD